MQAANQIRNIIFDLGGVIIDLDIPRTKNALVELGIPAALAEYSCNLTNDLFYAYETGKISSEQLRDEFRRLSGASFSDHDFDEAWCSMLLSLPEERVTLLERLNKEYRVFLLSNTSAIHALRFETMFLESAGIAMKDCFEKRYYSFETGLHKPDAEAFRLIVKEKGITPEQTLFIDDTLNNVKAAEALGFSTIHLRPGMQITELSL
ncbi:MAG: HAD family hydrolase [Bacteroidota bacterium]